MSFDGVMLRHVKEELEERLRGGRIQKVHQLDEATFLFSVRQQRTETLFLRFKGAEARLHLTQERHEKPYTPPMFCMLLRKHLEGGEIQAVRQQDNDRVLSFTVRTRMETGVKETRHVVMEFFGKDANLVLAKEDFTIIDALHRIAPFDERRTMVAGATYVWPEDKRIDPYREEDLAATLASLHSDNMWDYLGEIQGVSPQLIHEFFRRRKDKDPFEAFQEIIHEGVFEMKRNDKVRYASYAITHAAGETMRFPSPSALLDRVFSEKVRTHKERQRKDEIAGIVTKRRARIEERIEKLHAGLRKAEEYPLLQKRGELLLTYQSRVEKGDRHLECEDYETGETMRIEMDPKMSVVENATGYFERAKKQKKSIPHIKRRIIRSQREKEYLTLIASQLDEATLTELEEIRAELVREGYIRSKSESKKTRRQKASEPLSFIDETGTRILVGKNNDQNARITHELARAKDVWFHVKDAPGSHVVVKKGFPLEEATIRTAAQLAAHYSKMRLSSSVPVDYTEKKNIKKIPGRQPCFVTYKNHATIYIDPDADFIESLKKEDE